MMKKLVIAVVVIAAGLGAYNYFTTGKITLIPSFSVSEEERELKNLESRFHKAKSRFRSAGRAASLSGVDSTSDAEAARLEIERVEEALGQLKRRLDSEDAKRDAQRLERTIQEFKKNMR